jgi:6-phosphogluconolactonase
VEAGPDELAAAAIAAIAEAVREARDAGRTAHLALAGGSTPRRTYAGLPGLVGDWDGVELWLGDERAVPPGDPLSNFKTVAESLGGHPVLHRIAGESDPELAAQAYERELRERVEVHDGDGVPILDLALLGIGPDGHTASLFPGHPALEERERLCVAVHDSPKPPPTRITMTLPVLRAARRRLFLAEGADKAAALAQLVAGPDPDVPASLLGGDATLVLADPAAASQAAA